MKWNIADLRNIVVNMLANKQTLASDFNPVVGCVWTLDSVLGQTERARIHRGHPLRFYAKRKKSVDADKREDGYAQWGRLHLQLGYGIPRQQTPVPK